MSKIDHFSKNLCLPVVAAPMFLISGPQLVIECCKNGIVGTFPALNQRTTEGFEEWLVKIKEALNGFEKETGKEAAPFGVNLIVHKSNPRLQADLEICVKHKVPLIITSLGAVPDLVQAIHSYGGMVFHDVINKRHAEKAADAGVDGLIAVTAGAGGHAGTINPISLVAELRSFFDKSILLAGCLSNGQDIATALQMGADFAYMGTRFINTKESKAEEDYRKMIVESNSQDIVYTKSVSGVNGNFLWPSLEKAGFTKEMLKQTKDVDFGKELTIPEEGKAWKTIWSAGQGVVSIKDNPSVKELVQKLRTEFHKAINKQQKWLSKFP